MEKSRNPRRVVSIVVNALFYVLIALILVLSLAVISNKDRNQITSVFGRGIVPILSDSMDGNESNSFKKGDLLIVNLLSEDEKQNLAVGDTIVFYSVQYDALIAHRIIEVNTSVGFVITRGDKAEKDAVLSGNPIETYNDVPVIFASIQGLSMSIIPNVGGVVTYLQTPTGFGLIVVLPTILFLAYALIRFIRDLVKSKEGKIMQKSEEEKALLKQQLLEEIKKEQEGK